MFYIDHLIAASYGKGPKGRKMGASPVNRSQCLAASKHFSKQEAPTKT